MAKIKYATFTTGIGGKSANIVFYQSPSDRFGYMREYVYPRITSQNIEMGKIMDNLAEIWSGATSEYRDDMKVYAKGYSKLNPIRKELKARTSNPFSVFVLMMFNFQKAYPSSIGLDTITLGDIQSLFDEISSVASSVDHGYLPKVEGYAILDASI